MKVYYYRRNSIRRALEMEQPGQQFFGVNLFPQYGIDVVYNDQQWAQTIPEKIIQNLVNVKKMYFPKESYDAVYATSYSGIELLICLRSVKLFHKPIVSIRYTSVQKSCNPIIDFVLKAFHKGVDRTLIISEKSYQESCSSGVIPPEKLVYVNIGPDIEYYHEICASAKKSPGDWSNDFVFFSSGRENRDFRTLIRAFKETGKKLIIYTTASHGTNDYQAFFAASEDLSENIEVNILESPMSAKELALKAALADCVVCCVDKTNYNAGFSSFQEAVGLGKPLLITDNSYFGIDVEKEGIGLKIACHDLEGWIKAIRYIYDNKNIAKEMGQKAKIYAETKWNLETGVRKIIEVFSSLKRNK